MAGRSALRHAAETRSNQLTRSDHIAIVFVIGALLLLAVVPTAAGWYVGKKQDELRQVTRPARGWVTEAHVGLALGGAALRDFLTTGEPTNLLRYQTASAREQTAYLELRARLTQLDGRPQSEFRQLESWSAAWHREVAELLRAPRADPRALAAEESQYKRALLSAALLDEAITRAAERMDYQIDHAERAAQVATYGLVLVALLAMAVMVNIGRNMRRVVHELQAGRAELARVVESKAQLMRGMAHDVKNPLGAIQGYTTILEGGMKGQLNPDQHRCVVRIEKLVDAAVRIIDSLLDLAKIDSGRLKLKSQPTPIDRLVRQVTEEYRGGFEASGINLDVQIAAQGAGVWTDPERVAEVVGNLLSNANKYTPHHGRVTVRLAPEPQPDHPETKGIAIRVRDTGPGIDPVHQATVFDEFARVTTDSQAPGAGVGLAISRKLARLLGGDIRLSSTPGEGSEFLFWLPDAGPPTLTQRYEQS